jgi:aryl-alcohol dehydrogenase-like predicted oxidoreductase
LGAWYLLFGAFPYAVIPMLSDLRPLGSSGIQVSSVALGCWPIAGMTSRGVTEENSLATIAACSELGINFLDTAYAYGADGESEKMIARVLGSRRKEFVIATKGGIHWGPQGERVFDGRPATLRRECEISLQRLKTDHVDLLYLHAPDPSIPITESAGELKRLQEEGKTRAVGLSNASVEELEAFHAVCPLAAYQPAYNMLLRGIERDTIPWCREHRVAVVPYWPLMKGLLAGKLPRDFVFETGDGRKKYAMFQGAEWEKNQDLLDELRSLAAEMGRSVTEVVINWTIHQPGIVSALCGAKRPDQLRESAAAMGWELTAPQRARIERALAARGEPVQVSAV